MSSIFVWSNIRKTDRQLVVMEDVGTSDSDELGEHMIETIQNVVMYFNVLVQTLQNFAETKSRYTVFRSHFS